MIFNEIKCHVNTSLGLVEGCIPPVSAPELEKGLSFTKNVMIGEK